MQPSLGGLPPLLIQAGGGELLCDEQIYLAHKAANPAAYPPPAQYRELFDPDGDLVSKYPPTDVQLQVWEDLCHVAHTLSWTRPAKYMYRSVAQFGAWALARAQNRSIDILVDDEVSDISSGSESEEEARNLEETEKHRAGSGAQGGHQRHRHQQRRRQQQQQQQGTKGRSFPSGNNSNALPTIAPLSASAAVGKAGDPLPPFHEHMIRQRVDRHGAIHALAPAAELAALQMPTAEIGTIKEGPVRKWLAHQQKWNAMFAKEKRKWQGQRLAEMAEKPAGAGASARGFEAERVPATAMAGWKVGGRKGREDEEEEGMGLGRGGGKRSWGMSMWSGWGMKHDKSTVKREKEANKSAEKEANKLIENEANANNPRSASRGRARSRSKPAAAAAAADDDHADRSRSGDDLDADLQHLERPDLPARHSSRQTYRSVTDEGQAVSVDGNAVKMADDGATAPNRSKESNGGRGWGSLNRRADTGGGDLRKGGLVTMPTVIPPSDTETTRPTHGGVAYPFKLRVTEEDGRERNASTVTLAGSMGEGVEVGRGGGAGGSGSRSLSRHSVAEGSRLREEVDVGRGAVEDGVGVDGLGGRGRSERYVEMEGEGGKEVERERQGEEEESRDMGPWRGRMSGSNSTTLAMRVDGNGDDDADKKPERPVVERFVTANEF
ncbi:hypothetical protein LTS18_014406 [Coniosporium uncinatum]|uniref:Uncharacterized protein n=1 Tax=Coniosporium uncinatum TaxID=93489 RepID=A0ACC3D8Q6_9PEZI|nr:hypothetical protein LTS18_014406 [Coniosporium uncinatum]